MLNKNLFRYAKIKNTLKSIEDSIHNHRHFWYKLKCKTHKNVKHSIRTNIWFDYFKSLFATEVNSVDTDVMPIQGDIELSTFDSLITDEEVSYAVKFLNVNKACSANLTPRHFTTCLEILLPYIRQLFKLMFT
jgi:hypothetical protein